MRDSVICEPLRTAVGRVGGQFRDKSAHELGAAVVKALFERTKLPPDAVDDVLFAQCYPSMEAPALGRVVALDAGLPTSVGGLQLDRRCGSGLQTIVYACMQVATGGSDVVLAGGAESMSNAPVYSIAARRGLQRDGLHFHDALSRGRVTAGGANYPVPGGMLETAENLRREYKISREEQDEFAYMSQQKAMLAQKRGLFEEEIVPITARVGKETRAVTRDEHPRPETTVESLSTLRPILGQQDPNATVTAGNASGENDAASACIVTTPAKAAEFGLRPLARLKGWSIAGVPPRTMGIGPVPATARALERADLKLSDIDLVELNEAFAAQVLACTREWNFARADFDRLNVNGSGISLGHPVGATGGRILATLLREMHRRRAQFGLETMCIGGGQGIAAIFERHP